MEQQLLQLQEPQMRLRPARAAPALPRSGQQTSELKTQDRYGEPAKVCLSKANADKKAQEQYHPQNAQCHLLLLTMSRKK